MCTWVYINFYPSIFHLLFIGLLCTCTVHHMSECVRVCRFAGQICIHKMTLLFMWVIYFLAVCWRFSAYTVCLLHLTMLLVCVRCVVCVLCFACKYSRFFFFSRQFYLNFTLYVNCGTWHSQIIKSTILCGKNEYRLIVYTFSRSACSIVDRENSCFFLISYGTAHNLLVIHIHFDACRLERHCHFD